MRIFDEFTVLAKRLRFWLMVALALFSGATLAQPQPNNLRVGGVTHDSIRLVWDAGGPVTVSYHCDCGGDEVFVGATSGGSFKVRGLRPDTGYRLYVNYDGGARWLTVDQRTSAAPKATPGAAAPPYQPLRSTCPFLPPSVVVSGYGDGAHCQSVDAVGVGNAGLTSMGILDAVDVWGEVDSAIQVCFYGRGRLYFLDAAFAPRLLSDLTAERFDGMTCGKIDRSGTVVLVPLTRGGDGYVCATGSLRVRSGPSLDDDTIGFVRRGVSLPLIRRQQYWLEIEYRGRAAWIGAYYTSVDDCG